MYVPSPRAPTNGTPVSVLMESPQGNAQSTRASWRPSQADYRWTTVSVPVMRQSRVGRKGEWSSREGGFVLPTAYTMWCYAIEHRMFEACSYFRPSQYYYWRTGSMCLIPLEYLTRGQDRDCLEWSGYSLDRYNQCITECMAKVQNINLNLAVGAAEGPETVRFIAQSVKGIIKIATGIRKRSMSDITQGVRLVTGSRVTRKNGGKGLLRASKRFLAQSRRDASSAWLTYTYAFTPLLSDVYNAIDAFNKGISRGNTSFIVTRTVKGHKLETKSNITTQDSYHIGSWVHEQTFSYRCKMKYRIEEPWLALLGSLGLTNPLLLAWERLGFSFVFDWLIPIGTWLEAMTIPFGLKYKSGFTTVWGHAVVQANGLWQGVSSSVFIRGDMGRSTARYLSVVRRVLKTPPIPSVYVKNPFSSSHVTSALALVNNLKRR